MRISTFEMTKLIYSTILALLYTLPPILHGNESQ